MARLPASLIIRLRFSSALRQQKNAATMQIQIKTHQHNHQYPLHHFFILSKGNNAGKPLDKPCPNCFVVITTCPIEKQRLFWLCFGLWQGGFFHRHLCGSVIPFIRLPELKTILYEARAKAEQRKTEYEKTVHAMNQILHLQQNLTQQLQLIQQYKKSLMGKLLR
ncbi:MAG: hypothetical protein KF763_15485 [Cyclobacteriaceae bacterium]|nr:hypothetical protein [Cyclobacteriaceae bacterium]